MDFSTTSFLKEVSRARTFGFMRDLEMLRARNLALGGNLDNAIVLDDFRVLNEDGLRYEDEFVKHKILDAIGDLYLLGHSLIGEFSGHKSGHKLNNQLLRKLIADTATWESVVFEKPSDAPIAYVQPPPVPVGSRHLDAGDPRGKFLPRAVVHFPRACDSLMRRTSCASSSMHRGRYIGRRSLTCRIRQTRKLNRRALLLGAVLLVGGAAALTRFARKPGGAAPQRAGALAPSSSRCSSRSREVMIPDHRYAGRHRRRCAGVHARRCSTEWGSERIARRDCSACSRPSRNTPGARFGAAFLELAARAPPRSDARASMSERIAPPGSGVPQIQISGAARVTTSRKSAPRRSCAYELVPGAWRSCVPLSEVGRASAV